MYYERKKGEFSDGIKEKYITRKQIISRDLLLRLAMSCNGRSSQARRSSDRVIFEEQHFANVLKDLEASVDMYYYAYL